MTANHHNRLLTIHDRLLFIMERSGCAFCVLHHASCRTSVDSAVNRASADGQPSLGAKALLVVKEAQFAMLVLPGTARLDNKAARQLLGKFRFATADEIACVTSGLEPGMIPPFGAALFEQVGRLIVDPAIIDCSRIGFNAAHLERSIVMTGADYASVAGSLEITRLAI